MIKPLIERDYRLKNEKGNLLKEGQWHGENSFDEKEKERMLNLLSKAGRWTLACLVLLCVICTLIFPNDVHAVEGKTLDISKLEGQTFALVNGKTEVAMLAEENPNDSSTLAGMQVLRFDKDTGEVLVGPKDEGSDEGSKQDPVSEIKTWTFEAAEDGTDTYYLTTGNDDNKKYIQLGMAEQRGKSSVTLVLDKNEATKIKVTAKNNQVRLVNADDSKTAINLFGGTIDGGFGGWHKPDNNSDDPNEWFYLVSDVKAINEKVDGETPVGTVINMFDYWINGQDGPDNEDKEGDLERGINENHALKFRKYNKYLDSNDATMNHWRSEDYGKPYQGIVEPVLKDGYPFLSSTEVGKVKLKDNDNTYKAESLGYLFDPYAENESREVVRNVYGLLQTDEEGYYYYDSRKNFAELNKEEDKNKITLYNTWGVNGGGKAGEKGQFFPFNEFAKVYSAEGVDPQMNHYFGMTLTSRFVQQYGGHTKINRQKPMTFEFSGDDDVWIFIDNVLVADLGGIHDRSSVKIDFSTGDVVINKGTGYKEETTIYEKYQKAEKDGTVKWSKDESGNQIFEDGSFHTLKFFYLERGNTESNLSLKYNLKACPENAISKVDQDGNGVKDAKFAVYAADNDYKLKWANTPGSATVSLPKDYSYDNKGDIVVDGEVIAKALYTGTTDKKGKIVFKDETGAAYTMAELEDMFGSKFILKEIKAPDGYRQVGEQINLEIVDHKIMVSNNPKDSGAQAAATLHIDAPGTLALVDKTVQQEGIIKNGIVSYYDPEKVYDSSKDESEVKKGNVFAVVLRYIGPRDNGQATTEALKKQENWAPVYGTQAKGFVVKVPENNKDAFVKAAIDTAKKYEESTNVFKLDSSGAMQGQLNGMPGDIRNYYYMLGDNDKGKTEYTVAYYYTTGTLDNAKEDNTWRIDSTSSDPQYSFNRVFGTTINIPNLANKLLVQKVDEKNHLINGAGFAIYKVKEESDKKVYYIADGSDDETEIFLEQDKDGNNSGEAYLKGNSETMGTYTVKNEEGSSKGTIEVKIGENTYTITPVDYGVTGTNEAAKEDGTIIFTNLSDGQYYIREVSAPEGYQLNTKEVMVLVASDSIYANAGAAGDGIIVGQGPGRIVSTLNSYASQGQIDNTLTWIYTKMKISGESSTFSDVTAEKYASWKYIIKNGAASEKDTTPEKENALASYLKYSAKEETALFNYAINEKSNKEKVDSRRLYTDVGWSYLEIYQDYEYGKDKADGADYNNWSPQDLSHLFSHAVYIRVTDKEKPGGDGPGTTPDPEKKTGQLEISKTVVGDAADKEKAFNFTVTLKDKSGNELSGSFYYTGFNGASSGTITSGGTIHLKDGQSIIIKDLPEGTTYEVQEAEAGAEYTVSAVGDKGTIKANTKETAAFTNTKTTGEPGDLLISGAKSISGREFKEGDTFTFTVTAPEGTPMPEHSQVTIKPIGGTQAAVDFGKISFTEKDAGKTYTYTFVEKAGNISGISYDTAEKTVTVKVEKDKEGKLALTVDYGKDKNSLLWQNEYKSGKLTVSKTVSGDAGDKAKEFHFTVALSQKLTGTYGDMTFKDGKAEFTLKHGEIKTASGLPEGITYTVKEAEADQDGYKTSVTGDKGTISAGTAAAAFLNHKEKNDKPEDPTNPGGNTDPKDPSHNGGGDDPSKPSKGPDTPNTPGTQNPGTPNVARTGDDSSMTLWFGLLIASLAVITAVGLYTRRQKSDTKK